MDDMVAGGSRIMLGTAQFGLDYGIANRTGRRPYGEARGMVEHALGRGARSFDTAPGYGDSEKILGRIFRELGVSGDDVFVSDKVPPVPGGLSKKGAEEFIRGSVLSSLDRLGLASMDVCLFHGEKDAVFLDELLELKSEGLVGEAGVSVYNPGPALDIIGEGLAGALQVPASALDTRFLSAGFFEKAEEKGVSVFIRSVYLQGLMLMEDGQIPESLSEARPALGALRLLAGGAGLCFKEFVLRYALSLPGARAVIVGADGIEQLRENLDIAEKGPVGEELFRKAADCAPRLPDEVLLPFLWNSQKANV